MQSTDKIQTEHTSRRMELTWLTVFLEPVLQQHSCATQLPMGAGSYTHCLLLSLQNMKAWCLILLGQRERPSPCVNSGRMNSAGQTLIQYKCPRLKLNHGEIYTYITLWGGLKHTVDLAFLMPQPDCSPGQEATTWHNKRSTLLCWTK